MIDFIVVTICLSLSFLSGFFFGRKLGKKDHPIPRHSKNYSPDSDTSIPIDDTVGPIYRPTEYDLEIRKNPVMKDTMDAMSSLFSRMFRK